MLRIKWYKKYWYNIINDDTWDSQCSGYFTASKDKDAIVRGEMLAKHDVGILFYETDYTWGEWEKSDETWLCYVKDEDGEIAFRVRIWEDEDESTAKTETIATR